jgi:hypothetical protein
MKKLDSSDYLRLFYSKFNIDLPHTDPKFCILEFSGIFEQFATEVVGINPSSEYNESLKKLKDNEFIYFYINKKEDESFNFVFEYNKNNKIYVSRTVDMDYSNISIVDFYDAEVVEEFKLNIPENLSKYNIFDGCFFKKGNEIKLKKKRFFFDKENEQNVCSIEINNKEYILTETFVKAISSTWIEYFYREVKNSSYGSVDVSITMIQNNEIIDLNYFTCNNKYYLKNKNGNGSIFKNLSFNAVEYLNITGRYFKDITAEDFRYISLLAY